MATVKPCPSSPMRCDAGTRTPSSTTSPVGLPRMPSFSSCLAMVRPQSFSTKKHETPRPPASGSVLAKTMYTSEIPALVIQYLDPVNTYSSPSRTARARMEATSLPASASERQ